MGKFWTDSVILKSLSGHDEFFKSREPHTQLPQNNRETKTNNETTKSPVSVRYRESEKGRVRCTWLRTVLTPNETNVVSERLTGLET